MAKSLSCPGGRGLARGRQVRQERRQEANCGQKRADAVHDVEAHDVSELAEPGRAQAANPEGKAEELFHPFKQRSKNRSGLGLGLSISRRAVEANAGTLTVRNVPGTGCVFTIDLPRSAGT